MGEDLGEFFKVDFKDKLSYRGLDEDIKEYSNLQKWIIYKSYKNKDADIIIKKMSNCAMLLVGDNISISIVFLLWELILD